LAAIARAMGLSVTTLAQICKGEAA
jgi:hypothetical protein